MCYSLTGTACFEPSPHYPEWRYSCPAEELDGTPLWHAYEMAHNYGHAIMLCPEHRESHPKVLKKWYIGEAPRHISQGPEP